MTNRLVKTINDCKIYYNSEYEEFAVKPLWSEDEASHYFTDNLHDAEATAVSMSKDAVFTLTFEIPVKDD